VEQVAGYQKDGFLPNNAWAQSFADAKGNSELARGEALFRSQCMACHTREGYRSLKTLTAKNSAEDTVLLIQGLRELDPAMNPYLDRMPPFAGTDQEAEWLGKYLNSLNAR
jgi:mono/diheme cytochrome c family protein